MKTSALLLALTLSLGSPLHCLAEALNDPKPFPFAFGGAPSSAPGLVRADHCCHPDGLLKAAPLSVSHRASRGALTPANTGLPAAAAPVVLPLDHGPPRGGPRVHQAAPRRSLPLLV